jgi:small conductance mechanosensitive channel
MTIDALLISYIVDAGTALLILSAGFFLSSWARRLIAAALDRTGRVDLTLRPIIASVVHYAIMVAAIIAALAKAGIQTASILAVIGAAGLAIALALQGTLTNVASGVMLLFLRPFGIGDAVDCEGISGTVTQIGLFATEFETFDGLYVMVPNTQLLGRAIKNYSRLPFRRLDVKVGISYTDNIDEAVDIGIGLMNSDPRIVDYKAPQVLVERLGESSVDLVLRCWSRREDYWSLLYDMHKNVKQRFDAAGISIPFPQRDLHIVRK